jgi:glycosyltransferase involved in cell wall biosynthesis
LQICWKIKLKAFFVQKYLAFLRRFIADHIVYQSEFVKKQWDCQFGVLHKDYSIIYNGTDLELFKPNLPKPKPRNKNNSKYYFISVEGTQGNDPFDILIEFGKALQKKRKDFKILMVGKPRGKIHLKIQKYNFIKFIGEVGIEELPYLYSKSCAYVLTDIIGAGCPNSAIEALACGTPILTYNLGPITEMLSENAGILINSKGDPWKGENPRAFNELANGAEEIINNIYEFRYHARSLAEINYSKEKMAEKYLSLFL